MLSIASRKSRNYLRTLAFPIFYHPRIQPRPSNFRPISTGNEALISLSDILKPKATPTPMPTPNSTPTSTPTNGDSNTQRILFISRLPRWEVQALEERLERMFTMFGKISYIRVGSHADGTKYAHLKYQSAAHAQEALKNAKKAPVVIGEHKLTVALAGKGADPPQRVASLFFTGFRGNQDALRSLLRSNGYKSFQIFFFLGLQSGDGRIDFPGRTDVRQTYKMLNGMSLEGGAVLNLSYKDMPTQATEQSYDEPDRLEPGEAPPKSTKTFLVENLPLQIPEAELEAMMRDFFERHGSIASIHLTQTAPPTADEGKKPRRRCYVQYVHPHAALRASNAVAKEPLVIDDQQMSVSLVPPINSSVLYFRGFFGSARELREALGELSENAKKVKILFNPGTGRPTGNGIIEFRSGASAAEVLEKMDGTDFGGRKLVLTYYEPMRREPKRSAPVRDPDIASEPGRVEPRL